MTMKGENIKPRNKTFILICAMLCSALVFLSYVLVLRIFVYPLRFRDIVHKYAVRFEVSECLIFSVIKTESGFDASAKSLANAKGLMQLTDETAGYVAGMIGISEFDLFDAEDNICLGSAYLHYLSEKFGDKDNVIIAYNAGEGRLRAWLLDKEYSADGERIEKIPIEETREYLKKVNKNYNKYKKLYGKLLDKV